ncbi:hypothetical protein HCJ39_06880 [Listeria rocourtiae]|uniref:DUF6710 family protein n=1 Tax=Listeria rocourtiae TaxID=647910 RepID=UPI001629C0D0|nr:DUF6710 family protein [Listeria rocourtiae]MBC1604434.1 hypothetical protein [Listeria rocourtiae]
MKKLIRFLRNSEVKNDSLNNSTEAKTDTDRILFDNMLRQANDILKHESHSKEQVHPIFIYMKQLTDLITSENGVQSLTKGSIMSSTNIERIFEGRSDYNRNKVKYIELEKPHPEDLFAYQKNNYFIYELPIQQEFSNSPIILNPWHPDRTVRAIETIDTKMNKFDSKRHKSNLSNYYYYPIGVTLCSGGNHSQYSAKLKGNGSTSIRSIIDIRDVYAETSFEPEEGMSKHELYAGILFEIGRLLMGHSEVFPNEIRECIEKNEKI